MKRWLSTGMLGLFLGVALAPVGCRRSTPNDAPNGTSTTVTSAAPKMPATATASISTASVPPARCKAAGMEPTVLATLKLPPPQVYDGVPMDPVVVRVAERGELVVSTHAPTGGGALTRVPLDGAEAKTLVTYAL